FYPAQVTVAESHVGRLAVFSAAGYVCAALVTPPATRHVSKQAWITFMLIAAGIVTAALGGTFNEAAYMVIGFLMYLTRQGTAIAAVTILQEGIEDGFRGRVFAFYDMLYNAAFAFGATLFAVFIATNGKSPAVVAVVGYWLAAGRPSASSAAGPPSGAGAEPAAPADSSPAAEAQRSSS